MIVQWNRLHTQPSGIKKRRGRRGKSKGKGKGKIQRTEGQDGQKDNTGADGQYNG